MFVFVAEDKDQVGALAADIIIKASKRDGFRLGVATGSSPETLYDCLRRAHAAGDFDLSDAQAWALDEYVGIDADHHERYRNVLIRELVGVEKTGLVDHNLHTPDGLRDNPHEAAADYDRSIGDGVDVQILGIGSDGHIGFNEPSGSLASRTHVGFLTEQTRVDNARFFDGDLEKVPRYCITQGLATIMSAKKIVLVAYGQNKAEAIRQLVEGAVSARWPATILQHHPDVTVIVDHEAAAGLDLIDYYKQQSQSLPDSCR